jgi:putative acetyltransferase
VLEGALPPVDDGLFRFSPPLPAETIPMIAIRKETPADQDAIRRLYEIAFDQEAESYLIDRLRTGCPHYLSFVALQKDRVVGHILFTPVTLDSNGLSGMGLAPMAVSPALQKRGVGRQLVRHGLDSLRESGCPFVIVLGHPDYYPRFGFEPASAYRIESQWREVPDEAFLIMVFDHAALPKEGGVARYRPEFDEMI